MMSMVKEKLVSNTLWMPLVLLAGTCAMLAGCIPPRAVVHIPQEYKVKPAIPPTPVPSRSLETTPQAHENLPSPSGPLVTHSPAFTEKSMPLDNGSVAIHPSARQEPKAPAEDQPQHLASMHLVTQAKTALHQGRPDAAIALLEQAIQVDVYNGEAFFNLARAWQMKGVKQKAIEFARKAEIIFQDDRAELRRVYLLLADLYSETGDVRNAGVYRKKAEGIGRL
jgi:hypothetical protein